MQMSFEFHSSQLFVLQKRLAGFMRNKSLPTGHAQSFPLRGQTKRNEEKGRDRDRVGERKVGQVKYNR